MQRSSDVGKLVLSGLLMGLALLSGCGGNSSMSPHPPVSGENTHVVVLLTSTSNDKVMQFDMAMTSVSLNDSSGKSVSLFSKNFVQNGATGLTQFIPLNGAAQPLATVSVPQGTYTSATVNVAQCQFAVADVVSGGLVGSTFEQGLCGQGTGNTTVNLASPITISGQGMALALNLQIPQSYTLTSTVTGPSLFTISPVFTLTPVSIAANPTDLNNGKITGLEAQIASVNPAGNSFTAQTADGTMLNLSSSATTQFQGVSGLAALTAGTLVNLDSAIQMDGTLQATRLEVANPAAVVYDLMLPLSPASPPGTTISQPLECFPAPTFPLCISAFFISGSSVFRVSGQAINLANLPFTPIFDGSNLILGQNVAVGSNTSTLGQGGEVAADITLVPQTLNGTVTAVATAGNFDVYTVALAPYHIIPVMQQLAVVAPFATIANPTTVTVYADSSTQQLQSGTIGPGSLLRFRGLLFNAGGALRLDCTEILDGVTE